MNQAMLQEVLDIIVLQLLHHHMHSAYNSLRKTQCINEEGM
jgi:hypothetical protein